MIDIKIVLTMSIKDRIRIFQQMIYPFFNNRRFKKIGRQSYIKRPISLVGTRNIAIGDYVTILDGARIELIDSWNGAKYTPEMTINDGVVIGQNLHLTCASNIEIGSNTMIAHGVTITDINHDNIPVDVGPLQRNISTSSVRIGKNVFCGAGACIFKGSDIGDGSVIGANAVVLGLCAPPGSVIVGAPARVVKIND